MVQVLGMSQWQGLQVPPRTAARLRAEEPDEGVPSHHPPIFAVQLVLHVCANLCPASALASIMAFLSLSGTENGCTWCNGVSLKMVT